MKAVLLRKQRMVDHLLAAHVQRFHASGAELIMGEARFIGERTAEVKLNAGGMRVISGENVILSLGSRAAIPTIPGGWGFAQFSKNSLANEAIAEECFACHILAKSNGYIFTHDAP